ncbi:MAG: cardiolipin synthase [Peptococcaceae bacterium]|nr:cardiolipin synthase [Peptococcaceae bacterium]
MRSNSWRRILVVFLLLVQMLITAFFLYTTSQTFHNVYLLLIVTSILVALYVGGRQDNYAYKTLWIMTILIIPIFGGAFYLLLNHQEMGGKFRKRLREATSLVRSHAVQKESCLFLAREAWPDYAVLMSYLEKHAVFPVYAHTDAEFFDSGETLFVRVLEELEKAERYVFVESFIMAEGRMLGAILDKLEAKVKQGVLVRIMYDDFGCVGTLPKNYRQYLKSRGFQCAVFNPFRPVLSTLQNNRDHRKIISIDGKTVFTGGVNLADEYINEYERFGHWRDSGIMLRGEAAWGLTLVFLQLWNFSNNKFDDDFGGFYPWREETCAQETDGFVQPYADNPMDKENVGEQVYMRVISGAREYLYINTPYLIIDGVILAALKLAAKSGVDVRIMTPCIWDKRLVHYTTRSYYRELIETGVKIYEYTPGFNHSKTFVSDDRVATVGTVNLDYRSLYLHFECGVVMYGSGAVWDIKEDFLRTLSVCREIALEDCRNNVFVRTLQELLRIFAPLM